MMPKNEMEKQMLQDFAEMPVDANGPMRRARTLVEKHIKDYGAIPHYDVLVDAMATELGLAEIRGIDRIRLKAVQEADHSHEDCSGWNGPEQYNPYRSR